MEHPKSAPESAAGAPPAQESPKRSGRNSIALALVALAVGCALWGTGIFRGGSGRILQSAHTSNPGKLPQSSALETPAGQATSSAAGVSSGKEDEESAFDKLIVGSWEQIKSGKRLLNVLQNGTATMDVALDGAWSAVVGDKLQFQIEWKIENERLLFKMTGGKPEGSLKLISSIYGNERNHRIEKLTNDQLILIDEKDNSRDTWTRVIAAKQ